jgi:hypothetical protein
MASFACADAKCALENTTLSTKAISNKLEKARKQLPSDEAGIIFVKTPPHWTNDADFLKTVVDETRAFFFKNPTHRVGKVLCRAADN